MPDVVTKQKVEVVWNERRDGSSELVGSVYATFTPEPSYHDANLTEKKQQVATVRYWALGSCGCCELFRINYVSGINWDDVFDVLGDLCALTPQKEAEYGGHLYNVQEYIFLLADYQLTSPITTAKNVKKIDKWKNKSHGPCTLHLFRWSKQGDFT